MTVKTRTVLIDFGGHVSEAEAEPHNGGYYATSDHFGMMIWDDQHRSHPSFDKGSPLSWEYKENAS